MLQLLSTFSVHYPSIPEYRFGRPATDGNHLYETRVTISILNSYKDTACVFKMVPYVGGKCTCTGYIDNVHSKIVHQKNHFHVHKYFTILLGELYGVMHRKK